MLNFIYIYIYYLYVLLGINSSAERLKFRLILDGFIPTFTK